MEKRKGRQARDLGEPTNQYGHPWEGADKSTHVRCHGCGEVVKRGSAYTHVKGDECKARTEIKSFRARGLREVGFWAMPVVELFPAECFARPEIGATSFRRGGWGRPNKVSRGLYAAPDVAKLIAATRGCEDLQVHAKESAFNRLRTWFGAIFANEENMRAALLVFAADFGDETDLYSVAHFRRADARAWADKVSLLLDVPPPATEEQRRAEDDELCRKADEEYRRRCQEKREALQAEQEARRALVNRQDRWAVNLEALVTAARNVAQPGSNLSTILEDYFADFDPYVWGTRHK